MGEGASFTLGPPRPASHGRGALLRFGTTEAYAAWAGGTPSLSPRPPGGRPGPVLVCDPPPPRVLKDSGAGSATNKCPYRKPSAAEGANFFLHTMCLYSKCSKFCREFIFVLK